MVEISSSKCLDKFPLVKSMLPDSFVVTNINHHATVLLVKNNYQD